MACDSALADSNNSSPCEAGRISSCQASESFVTSPKLERPTRKADNFLGRLLRRIRCCSGALLSVRRIFGGIGFVLVLPPPPPARPRIGRGVFEDEGRERGGDVVTRFECANQRGNATMHPRVSTIREAGRARNAFNAVTPAATRLYGISNINSAFRKSGLFLTRSSASK